MRKHLPYRFVAIAIALILFSSVSSAQNSNNSNSTKLPRPKLVVGLVVDQMRWDYLYRYYDRYGEGGFKRMINEGFSADNTNIDYVPTVTAIGHSTIYTGSVPSIHGIAGNDFIINATGQTMYCTEDGTVSTVGSTSKAGEMSPRNLLTSTVTDELRLATNFRSKVIGISIKDRGSILPAGHTGDAYWFDGESGNFITSTYYMDKLPTWVDEFNKQNLIEKYMNQGWETLYPINTYIQSTADDNKFEGKFSGAEKPVFPVNTADLYKRNGSGAIRTSPYGNTFSFDMAKAAIENEKLGQNVVTDFLALSLSSTDYIGHQFGPNSIEVEDTYLRLDKEMADFFKYLDEKVGAGEYTVFLSADHGGAHNVTFLKEHNIAAGAWPTGKVLTELNSVLQTKFGEEKLMLSLMNYQGHLNYKVIEEKGLDSDAITSAAINFLRKQEGVTYVVDMDKIQSASIPQVLRERIINGYNYARSGNIQIILDPAWYSSGSANPTGTSHSAWNPYDAHIPLVFMGWGVNQGKTDRPTHMTDIAATLAAILKIQQPNGSIGIPILEAIKK
jgi:predicted AlkP superfamily pyrophosphatase or phosphodiesterase